MPSLLGATWLPLTETTLWNGGTTMDNSAAQQAATVTAKAIHILALCSYEGEAMYWTNSWQSWSVPTHQWQLLTVFAGVHAGLVPSVSTLWVLLC